MNSYSGLTLISDTNNEHGDYKVLLNPGQKPVGYIEPA